MKLTASLLFIGLVAATPVLFVHKYTDVSSARPPGKKVATEDMSRSMIMERLRSKGEALRAYTTANHFNTQYAFLVDMHVPSGKARFFVYDLEKDSVLAAGLVAHGCGSDVGNGELHFSDVAESKCTSLGKYRVGGSYNGTFGLAYKLYGLDKTNHGAFSRFVVLHSYHSVPENETYPEPICESWGCPMVAPSFLLSLKSYLDNSPKPVLLWIYY